MADPGLKFSDKRRHFANFSKVLPQYCDELGLDPDDIQFAEYVTMVEEWLKSAD